MEKNSFVLSTFPLHFIRWGLPLAWEGSLYRKLNNEFGKVLVDNSLHMVLQKNESILSILLLQEGILKRHHVFQTCWQHLSLLTEPASGTAPWLVMETIILRVVEIHFISYACEVLRIWQHQCVTHDVLEGISKKHSYSGLRYTNTEPQMYFFHT